MPLPPENLAMVEGDWPSANSRRNETAGQPSGPLRGEAHSTPSFVRLAKFRAPEIGFGPGALAELATNPREADARDIEAIFQAAL